MAVQLVDLDDFYIPITDNQDIEVFVETGDGQPSAYAIFSGLEFIASNQPANLGNRQQIGSKNTIISVTIVDTLTTTNWTSMRVLIRESGAETIYGPYKVRADNHLDTVVYSLRLIHSI